MAGIVSYGSYIPYRRLKRAAIAAGARYHPRPRRTLRRQLRRGQRLDGRRGSPRRAERRPVCRNPFARFRDDHPALRRKAQRRARRRRREAPAEIRATDSTGSIRAGLSAILQAADAVTATGGSAAVAIADSRLGAPEGKTEQSGGDGAAAFIIGTQNVIAEIEASASLTREFLDTWRNQGERFAHSWEERFALTQAHNPLFKQIIHDVLTRPRSRSAISPKSSSTRPTSAPPMKSSRELKVDPSKVADQFRPDRRPDRRRARRPDAHLGAARREPGDRILVATVADGADAILSSRHARRLPASSRCIPSAGWSNPRVTCPTPTISSGARFCRPSRRAAPIPSGPPARR